MNTYFQWHSAFSTLLIYSKHTCHGSLFRMGHNYLNMIFLDTFCCIYCQYIGAGKYLSSRSSYGGPQLCVFWRLRKPKTAYRKPLTCIFSLFAYFFPLKPHFFVVYHVDEKMILFYFSLFSFCCCVPMIVVVVFVSRMVHFSSSQAYNHANREINKKGRLYKLERVICCLQLAMHLLRCNCWC